MMEDRFGRTIDKHVDDFLVAQFRVQDGADQEEPTQAYILYVEERDDAVG